MRRTTDEEVENLNKRKRVAEAASAFCVLLSGKVLSLSL